MAQFLNLAAYRFARLTDLTGRRAALRKRCRELQLAGTILLSKEGINLFIAGEVSAVRCLLAELRSDPVLSELDGKESYSDHQPFSRMVVKIKRQIIAFVQGIDPLRDHAPRVQPTTLKQWLDEGRDLVLLDVRNDYEISLGTFRGAKRLGLKYFRQFPQRATEQTDLPRDKTIVSFCTGGIRCEKAAPYLLKQGFAEVYQLDGGILNYFEQCGSAHYQGECFVFDKRVALDPSLAETETTQCFNCQAVLSKEQQQDPNYRHGLHCPNCIESKEQHWLRLAKAHEENIRAVATPLPGLQPYTNRRPIRVSGRYDDWTLAAFLRALHPHLGETYWRQACQEARLECRGQPVTLEHRVRGGDTLLHYIPNTTEPVVNTQVVILFEDEALFVVNKPAPLPVHPCGRFHRHTLSYLLRLAIREVKLRPVHRLDADTTGVQIFCKSRDSARSVQEQFERRKVRKLYLAEVSGRCEARFTAKMPLSTAPSGAGTRRIGEKTAETRFRTLVASAQSSLISCEPLTGRTHQLRIHLAELGHPIVGDRAYSADSDLGQGLTAQADQPLHLHASKLCIQHPQSNRWVEFTAPSPQWANAFSSDGHPTRLAGR